jgi:maltose/moltooligosaccharide transporter
MSSSAKTIKNAKKPTMNFGQVLNMSVGFLGIQFGYALQTGNASRILQTFGADVDKLTWFWLAAPLTGMIIQPIIGHYSDNTWTKLGRRKPYFLAGAIIAALSLFFMPNGSLLATIMPAMLVGAGTLMIMDASFNVSMEPFRALVADDLPDEQHNQGFSVQTALIGVGAVIGSLLPYALATWFGIDKTAKKGIVPHNVLYSFYTGAIILVATVLWTVFTTKEYPPDEYASFHADETDKEKDQPKRSAVKEVFYNLIHMPKTMKQLALVQFFSWYALFSMWVFTTPAIAQHIFHIKTGDTSSAGYNNAANWVDILFAVYNGVSAVYALVLPHILKKISRKKMHAFALIMGGFGLVSLLFIQNQYVLIIPMIGIGLAWGSALAIPYAILSSSIPPAKTGVYMGIFNFTITIPQILNGIIGGLLVKHVFHNDPIYALVMAGVFLFISAATVFQVQDKDTEQAHS